MSVSLLVPDTLLCDPSFAQLKDHILAVTGLYYYKDKDPDLASRLGRRLSTQALRDCGSYLEILRDPLRGPAELDELIAEITIGETYFFRHQEHFDALRDIVFPDLIARNRAARNLRIWCAGCADGPEPYSLAILMKRDLAQPLDGWTVSILGTDINRRCLARARQGKFEEWALRATPEAIKRECFLQEGKHWVIQPGYRESVAFQYHNLAEHPFPSLINNLSAFDLIVCRNVMIYFASDLIERMIGHFHACLVPGAWLLVGPTEPNMSSFGGFRLVNALGVTLYQRPIHAAAPLETISAVVELPVLPSFPEPPCIPVSLDQVPPPTLADVRQAADRGDWEEALAYCERVLETEVLNSVAHLYRALILEQTGQHAETEKALRRAIYLDRQWVLPHYYLGLFLQARGRLGLAVRSFKNALALLDSRSDSESFPDADGITVAEMKTLAKMQIDVLGQENKA